MAPEGQVSMHSPHPTHFLGSIKAMLCFVSTWDCGGTIEIASCAHQIRQLSHPLHAFFLTWGEIFECWLNFPSRLEHPIPKFFKAPPNPDSSWPLKWVTVIRVSVMYISRAMETVLKIGLSI